MSIFSGWSPEDFEILKNGIRTSPSALAVIGIAAVICVLAVGFAVGMLTHHIGGFYEHIHEEDEKAREEEEQRLQNAHDMGETEKTDL